MSDPSPTLRARKPQKIRGKIGNVGAPTFFGGVYPPVFAYVGEGKGLRARSAYVGERKEIEESGEWLVASGELKQRKERKEKKDSTAKDTLRLRSGQAEDAEATE